MSSCADEARERVSIKFFALVSFVKRVMSSPLYIVIQNGNTPITPDDECWVDDGRVYVRFVDLDSPPCIVGTLSDPTIAGKHALRIMGCHPYEVRVEIITE